MLKLMRRETSNSCNCLLKTPACFAAFSLFFFSFSCISIEKSSKNGQYNGIETFSELLEKVEHKSVSVNAFKKTGPFDVSLQEDYSIAISPSEIPVVADIYTPEHDSRAPLIIFVHGSVASKKAHKIQAVHLASWGFYSMVVSLPSEDRWMKNGATIDALTRLIKKWPYIVNSHIDDRKIYLVGHSFGGSAVTIATGRGAPVDGLILLDPAVVNNNVQSYMRKVSVPVMLLGADKDVFKSRRRKMFFDNIDEKIAEISVKGATHNDAQYPSMFGAYMFGFDPFTSESLQKEFLQAITITAFSFTTTNSLDYAWEMFKGKVDEGVFINARRK